ncbi:hypothetical protein BpHYR1_032084 [Brachionus plicatilis]|uniref:Uncharacterized protein n=1 Tax=Brachionus plicatilis TaxID=10195 RepID=A0A3M7T836_BRAPC|nr:hypothetical protein BpHYR1_032084 [Brachionus plicatilis]
MEINFHLEIIQLSVFPQNVWPLEILQLIIETVKSLAFKNICYYPYDTLKFETKQKFEICFLQKLCKFSNKRID